METERNALLITPCFAGNYFPKRLSVAANDKALQNLHVAGGSGGLLHLQLRAWLGRMAGGVLTSSPLGTVLASCF